MNYISIRFIFFSGFEEAQRLLLIGGGCLIIVLIFGFILCRLDISAGNSTYSNICSS